jgi:hypothetical protein
MSILGLHGANGSRSAWLQWTLATAAGSTLGAVVGGALITTWLQSFPPVSDPLATAEITIPRIAGAFAVWGAGIGLMQTLLLRRRVVGAYWWPLATLSGWAIAGALTSALPVGGAVTGRGIDIGPLGFVAHAVATVLAIGLLSGLFQWLILKRQADRAGRWVWITAGGVILGMLVAAALLLGPASATGWLRPEDFPSATSWGIAGALVGLVYGAASGWALIRLPRPQTIRQVSAG